MEKAYLHHLAATSDKASTSTQHYEDLLTRSI